MSTLNARELGIVEAVLKDFNDHRLPRLLDMEKRVDDGEPLSEYDLDYLKAAVERTRSNESFADVHPEFKTLVLGVSKLYDHITVKALQNEG